MGTTTILLVAIAIHFAASKELFFSDFTGPSTVTSDSNGASFVYDDYFDRNVLQLDGTNGYALVPAVKFQKSDFTIVMWFKSTANGKRQILYADWSKEWQFLIAVQSDGKIQVTLRRNINSGGSNPNQDLLTALGGDVKRDAWQHLVVTYENEPGTCVVYLDGDEVASATTTYSDHDLQENSHPTYEVGYKKDSNSDFFDGRIGFLKVADVAICSTDSDLYRSYFKDSADHITSLSNGASFVHDYDFGRSVLQLDGTSGYALVPAVKFQKSDFTIEMWFKSTANGKRQILYADWTKEWQFLIAVQSDGKIQVTLRRNINSGGSQGDQDLLTALGGDVERDTWEHLIVTYSNAPGTCVVYLDGDEVASATTKYSDHDLQENSHPTYEVGYKKDSNSDFFNGRIGFLRVSGEEYTPGSCQGRV
ncbi:uncharacterized protein LOC135488648 [Lineus longissimus]|uniref:uncharacterized protein LOC135488648 n=1 Tax=Lineus longissimus TaxID=88925 RepID=UPI002B4E8409